MVEQGLNARTAMCPVCYKGSGIVYLKDKQYKAHCKKCSKDLYGLYKDDDRCPHCKDKIETVYITEKEHIPVMCTECQEKHDKAVEIAKEGGIIFKCLNCLAEGAFDKNSPIAKNVRATMKVMPPALCGVQLDTCPLCENNKKDSTVPETVQKEQ